MHRLLRTAFAAVALAWAVAAAQGTPPWGAVAYVAEVAQSLDGEPLGTLRLEVGPEGVRYTAFAPDGAVDLEVLLTWDGAAWAAYATEAPGGSFEPAFPGLGEAVLAAVVDPRTPGLGTCALMGATCVEVGEGDVGGRPALRLEVSVPDLGTSTVWVDRATGLAVAGEGSAEGVAVRTVLVSLEERAPDPARLRP